MKKTLGKCLSVAVVSTVVSVPALANQNIVYGVDNRTDIYQTNKTVQRLASATAGMIKSVKAVKLGNKIMLPPYTIKKDMKLCDGERFADQPSAVVCSGFLVGPDLLVTAGHCVQNQSDCDEVSWVFDYKVKESTKRTDVLVDAKKVFKCKKVIEAKLSSEGGKKIDYALIRLERAVKGVRPLKYRTKGKVGSDSDVFVIGYPSGLPAKYAPGAKVLKNSPENYFLTNLDTFGGNSGSSVFNGKTKEVEGILVRGAKDYVSDPSGCRKVNTVAQDVTDFSQGGESVSRITDIKTLKYRFQFLKAAEEGNIETLKELLPKIADRDIYDNEMNSALHKAASAGQMDALNFLIANRVTLDAQNLKGETALHLAAFNNKIEVIKSLVRNGASTLIKDNMGDLPRDRTMYLSFGTRKLLKSAEYKEKKRKQLAQQQADKE
jgi:V8-like Glu-specific endopeptidase